MTTPSAAAGRAAQDLHEIEVLLASPVPIIAIDTHEEHRVLALLVQLAVRARRPLYRWSITDGLARIDIEMPAERRNTDPGMLLAEMKRATVPAIYALMDFEPYLEEALNVRHLKDLAIDRKVRHSIVLVGHRVELPDALRRYSARFELSMPERGDIERIVREEAQNWSRTRRQERITADRVLLARLLDNLLGLPADDVRRLARRALADDGALTDADIPAIQKEKFRLLSQGGVLSFEHDTARFSEIGGFARMKHWLEVRRPAFRDASAEGLDPPKGILLLGVQGCGKSLAAKAVAGAWGVALLRLDFGALYDKFYGESERNLRESLRTATAMAPCVLWIDELEKGISTDAHDGGTSRRVFGTFLTWLAENRAPVFVVATANDIASLPPELVRKGRFDEIFFVDLPDVRARVEILGIHLRRRGLDLSGFDLEAVAEICVGFSGAELEQVVVSSLYCARAQNSQLGTAHLLAEAAQTRPLAVVMRERVDALRTWARGRTVLAD